MPSVEPSGNRRRCRAEVPIPDFPTLNQLAYCMKGAQRSIATGMPR